MGNRGSNSKLTRAKKAKNDEFYTRYEDIESELVHYKNHFKGKTVLCNCDDPRVSNFFKYFALNFEYLGLKRIIVTGYKKNEHAVYLIYDGNNGKRMPDFGKVRIEQLKGDGDFRSAECISLLLQADIVVTNPPFSLFREYVAQLMAYDKKFIIIGNQNAITYKEIFPLIKGNRIWLGYKYGDMAFRVPADTEPRKTRYWQDETGQKWRSMGNICWFTNLDHTKRHEDLKLYKKYTPEEYPKYDNYDAINVDKVAEIPYDYNGVMGVPISFLAKYNPDQFEIVEFRKGKDGKDLVFSDFFLGGGKKQPYFRILTGDADKRADEQPERHKGSREEQICENSCSSTAIPGMIKNAEGSMGGGTRRAYARILIRRIHKDNGKLTL